MKLSGHNFDNGTFDSLLEGLSGDVVLKKQASKPQQENISGSNVFSSTTEEDLNAIHEEDLKFIASELQFAADNAKVAVTQQDLAKFAKQVTNEKLRGKNMERAARKFCSELQRAVADPQGPTRRSASLTDQMHGVVPAGYNPDEGPNDSKTAGYMGMSKNPNTIWDSGSLSQFAEKPQNQADMLGDEQIKQSQEQRKEYRQAMKDEQWQEKQDMLSDENMLHNKIASTHTGNEQGTGQALPENGMSMFNGNRDFENIPDKTAGETLKEAASERANKSAAAKGEWNKVEPAKKADNTLPSFFAGDTQEVDPNSASQRESIDKVFESLL